MWVWKVVWLFVSPAIDWCSVQGESCLVLKVSWDWPQLFCDHAMHKWDRKFLPKNKPWIRKHQWMSDSLWKLDKWVLRTNFLLFANIGVEELKWPAQSTDLNPTKHIWDKLEHLLHIRPSCWTSGPDLTDAFVARWAQILTARLQNPVKSLLRKQRVL